MGSPGDRPDVRWWLDPERVQGFVHGVFEGGGAKGTLYVGAMKGVLRRKLWFSAVAGSSAGAITAAMIAAGMGPNDMRAASDEGLEALAMPTALSGLRRVRWGTGFLDHEGVLAWLRDVLRARCEAFGLQVDERGPTFDDLFRGATGIELFVAAVDLRARHLAVFHHALTPNARVADAVMASASIPVAFEPLVFQSSFKDRPRWRLFVDGGVASNYPSFVFQDEAFRNYAGLGPRPEDTPVVGFLLDEAVPERREETRDVYRSGDFIGPYYDGVGVISEVAGARTFRRPRFRRLTDGRMPGWRRPFRPVGRALGAVLGVLEVILLTMVGWLAWAWEPGGAREAFTWNWRDPKNRHTRLWVRGLRGWLSTAPVPLVVGIVGYTAMFWLGFVVVARFLVPDLDVPDLDWESILGFLIGLLLSLAALILATWIWLLGLVTFLSLRVAYRTVGILGADIFQTYLNTSAPPWAGCGPNERLIRLKIPQGVTTLKVAEGLDEESMLQHAERLAFRRLEGVRGGPAPS